MLPAIVAFVGLSGAGKDTAANALHAEVEARGGRVARISFAAAAKDVAATALHLPRELLEGDTPESRAWRTRPCTEQLQAGLRRPGVTPLDLLRDVAMALRERVSPYVWVHLALERMRAQLAAGATLILITDLRFPQEFEALLRAKDSEGRPLFTLHVVHVRRGPQPPWWQEAAVDPAALAPERYAATAAMHEGHGHAPWAEQPPHISDVAWVQPLERLSPHMRGTLDNDGSAADLQAAVVAMAAGRGILPPASDRVGVQLRRWWPWAAGALAVGVTALVGTSVLRRRRGRPW